MGIIEKIAVDSATLAKLEENAKAHGRSVEEEAAEILKRSTGAMTRAEIIARMDEIAAMTPKGVKQTDSTLLIREDRDR
jgi:plasmid stability protein